MSKLRVVNSTLGSGAAGPTSVLSDIELLHSISIDLIGEQDSTALYGKIVDAAMAVTDAQFGTMQLVLGNGDGEEPGLRLLTSRGLSPQDQAVWSWVSPRNFSSCTEALKLGRRAVISDFETWDDIAGTEDLQAFRRAGIRSAQTTPLISRNGKLLGMISTHWAQPHEPTERDLRLLDIIARQAADLLERTLADEKLREREKELEASVAALRESQELQHLLTAELGHRVKNLFAMVSAITSSTFRGSNEQARVHTLRERLTALSSAHDILLQSDWKAAALADVAAEAARSAGVSGRIRVSGPDVEIGSRAALNLALLLHELTTNALKHGSLSVGGGCVDLAWRLEETSDGEALRLTWRESKGPEVSKPERTGFGSKLISAGLSGSGGTVIAYNPAGLMCEVTALLRDLQASA